MSLEPIDASVAISWPPFLALVPLLIAWFGIDELSPPRAGSVSADHACGERAEIASRRKPGCRAGEIGSGPGGFAGARSA
ncbi:hypothetical protein [Nocardia sp. NPDC004722]